MHSGSHFSLKGKGMELANSLEKSWREKACVLTTVFSKTSRSEVRLDSRVQEKQTLCLSQLSKDPDTNSRNSKYKLQSEARRIRSGKLVRRISWGGIIKDSWGLLFPSSSAHTLLHTSEHSPVSTNEEQPFPPISCPNLNSRTTLHKTLPYPLTSLSLVVNSLMLSKSEIDWFVFVIFWGFPSFKVSKQYYLIQRILSSTSHFENVRLKGYTSTMVWITNRLVESDHCYYQWNINKKQWDFISHQQNISNISAEYI